ncbi:hypothetical protein HZ989_10600 [Brevundimonas sp. AJA228-03]|uniref:hypothetical protein n=1 Tax=Brevundimonas sp. AJA228-03 TaxID=2752515 RepID=UPI001AE03F33|nr:hypothetical protein [Brevundimonas sp. AJA228-03]QTN18696.1 hypothetical protein HZ989_10600 [Brevundimonas sp. AJA228-03]
MQRHLERSVVLDNVSDFRNLYSWSVSEIADASASTATKQIPWTWSLYFTLFDVQLVSSVSRDQYGTVGEEAPKLVEKTHILAKLRSGHPPDQSHPTEYSMFGTARKIEDLTLSIYRRSAADIDDCRVFGGVSYTCDPDFREETYPDYLGFTLYVRDEFFAQIASRIDQRAIGGGTLRVDGVEGFYSDWSPSISTSHIKVLTSDKKDHPVQTPEGCEIVPPRLGKVGDFDLTLWSQSLNPSAVGASVENENAPAHTSGRDASLRSPLIDPKVLTLLKSLRLVAWVIAALLLIVALK